MADNITIVPNQADLEAQFAFVNSVIERYRSSAISMINTAALQMNWEIGQYISMQLKSARWGTKIVSDLKARISYGVTGNQEIGNYQSLSTLSSSRYLFNEETAIGFRPDRISNAELGWETTHQYDVGIDAGLFGGRLNISLDYYYKKIFYCFNIIK